MSEEDKSKRTADQPRGNVLYRHYIEPLKRHPLLVSAVYVVFSIVYGLVLFYHFPNIFGSDLYLFASSVLGRQPEITLDVLGDEIYRVGGRSVALKRVLLAGKNGDFSDLSIRFDAPAAVREIRVDSKGSPRCTVRKERRENNRSMYDVACNSLLEEQTIYFTLVFDGPEGSSPDVSNSAEVIVEVIAIYKEGIMVGTSALAVLGGSA